MAYVLSLTVDCLRRIVSFVDDPSSFTVTKNTRNVLHKKFLRVKVMDTLGQTLLLMSNLVDELCFQHY